jgi:amino acid transporter
VLAGAVLTAYVGVVGLMQRLALDRVLPEVFMATNKWRGTAHWVIIGFFVLTSTLFLILNVGSSSGSKSMENLSGVYALVSMLLKQHDTGR